MDSFTAGILLSAVMNGSDQNQVADLYKMFNDSAPNKIDQLMEKKVSDLVGQRCSIKYTTYKGTIVGFNSSLGGCYGGDRFPYLVRIDETMDGRKDVVFEYGDDDIILEERK